MSNFKTKNTTNECLDIVHIDEVRENTLPPLLPEGEVIDEVIDLKEMHTLKMYKIIMELENKLLNGRIKDKEKEQIRLEYYKIYINACNSFNTLLKNSHTKYNKEKFKDFINK